MPFFTPDLYQRIGLGFLIGAAFIAAANAEPLADEISAPAQAASLSQAPLPAPDFLIAPQT